MEISVLCDAVAVFPESVEAALPGWSAEHRAWTEIVAPGNVTGGGEWLLHFHSFLLTDDRTAMLVDTGIGPAGSPAADWLGTTGRLPDLLVAAGVHVSDIDTVVLTHVHLDHTGWNADGPDPLFANASYVVQQAELDHVRDTPTYERLLAPVAGQLRTVDGETTIHGVTLLPTPGHTPGHQSVLAGDRLLAGDALVHPAQASWPELRYVYETDPVAAAHTRRTLVELAEAGVRLAPSHLAAELELSEGELRSITVCR